MGTFHHDHHELHGITVVVDTEGERAYIGRCHTVTSEGVYLHDADVYEASEGGPDKQAWIQRAAAVGIWKKHDRLLVPTGEVASITPLGQVTP